MDITLDPNSPTPPYEQVRTRIIEDIRDGTLPAGHRLPTVRGLAEHLGIAANTVARAYRELEADGFIETRGRSGSFVSAQGDATERAAQEAARVYADRVATLGVDASTALRYVKSALGG